jgi:acetoin utilization deacetylase AcuC-like enzyme
MTQQLKTLADKYAEGRLISVLEGGYNLTALKQSVLAHLCELARK